MELSQLGNLIGSVIAPIAGDLAVLRTRIDAHDQTLAQLHKRADGAHERIDDVLKGR